MEKELSTYECPKCGRVRKGNPAEKIPCVGRVFWGIHELAFMIETKRGVVTK